MADELATSLALKKLREFDPAAIEDARIFRNEITLYIHPEHFFRACEFLRADPELKFKFLADITALDLYPQEPRFDLVYQLLSIDTTQRLRLKVRVGGEDPRFGTAVHVWPAANAYECEIFDLFGVVFEGHPFLRRLMMPEDWKGYPLRKDYPTEGYR